MSSDPLRPIVRLFERLVKEIRRPIVVFVDDLDRCDSKYVVELLEGIQTLFRTAPVTYVVAADRKWICSSFEKAYADFADTVGEAGRPLGYLFLDKIFQISATLPRLPLEVRQEYWKSLLDASPSSDPQALEATRKQAERRALERVKDDHTQEALEAKIAEVHGDPVEEQAMRAAAAKQITGAEAQRRTEHRLHRFAHLIEPNPRSMKRLVNAYGLHQATNFLEAREISPEALALWTIVEMRWPLLADLLAARPQIVSAIVTGKPPVDESISPELLRLFSSEAVKEVVAGNNTTEIGSLDDILIRQLVGLPRVMTLPTTTAEPPASGTNGQGQFDG